jgi:hypothetical protein
MCDETIIFINHEDVNVCNPFPNTSQEFDVVREKELIIHVEEIEEQQDKIHVDNDHSYIIVNLKNHV